MAALVALRCAAGEDEREGGDIATRADLPRGEAERVQNCLAMPEGVIPALKAARTAFTWPRVPACRLIGRQ
jgi:hypothetical protein